MVEGTSLCRSFGDNVEIIRDDQGDHSVARLISEKPSLATRGVVKQVHKYFNASEEAPQTVNGTKPRNMQ